MDCKLIGETTTGTGETSPPPNFWVGDQQCIGPLNVLVGRSFSSLRRLKTYLRNSMSQQRLNHLAVLHVQYTGTDYTALTLMSLHESLLQSLRIV